MATSGHTLTTHQSRHLLNTNTLNVQGRGLSPNRSSKQDDDGHIMARGSNSSRTLSVSDEEDEDESMRSYQSEEYTVLDGVKQMNHMLVRQIETLRLKIQVDEKNHKASKAELVKQSESRIRRKESEIDDLRDSINNRDERIQNLEKAAYEKDKQIQANCEEIESLKSAVKQTQEYAKKLQSHAKRSQSRGPPGEDDDVEYGKGGHKEEMVKLTEELELLRSRLNTMEKELQRAMEVIQIQNEKMDAMVEERGLLHTRFKEDLDKATKSMRQEVERMREVMRQNYEEMKQVREQNKKMGDDVREIKKMLEMRVLSTEPSIENGDQQYNTQHLEQTYTQRREMVLPKGTVGANKGRNKADHESSPYAEQMYGQRDALAPRGPTGMVGKGHKILSVNSQNEQSYSIHSKKQRSFMAERTASLQNRNNKEPTPTHTSVIYTSTNRPISGRGGAHQVPHSETSRSHMLSPDRISRPIVQGEQSSRTGGGYGRPSSRQNNTQHHPNVPPYSAREITKSFPPICSIKEAVDRQPSARGAKMTVKRGSSFRK